MKSSKKIFIAGIALSVPFILSCASASVNSTEKSLDKEIPVVETADETDVEAAAETEAVEEQISLTPEEEYIQRLNDISICVAEAPGETSVNKAFSSSYTFKVTENDLPAADFSLTITFPEAKKGTEILYRTETVTTDSEGIYSFTPAAANFAANTFVTVKPASDFTDEAVAAAIKEKAVSAEYKVKSNMIQSGCLLFVWEYNEKNRATNNFVELQGELRTRGSYMCGNAPLNESSDIGKPLTTLYKQNYEIVEDMYGYLLVGTVKFVQPVTAMEDGSGYLCSLIAEISAVNMKTGEKVFEQTFTQDSVGANWTKATTTCKNTLAKNMVDALIYGL